MRPVVVRAGGRAGRLLLVTGCLILGVFGLGAVDAHAATAASLGGETFTSQQVEGSTLTGACNQEGGSFSFSVSGTAAGPFPGTFSESGSFSALSDGFMTGFSATFTITSTAGMVTGTKTWVPNDEPIGSLCFDNTGFLTLSNLATTYTATINGTGGDRGAATVSIKGIVGGGTPIFSENFGSGVGGPPAPISEDQCKHGGWKSFGQIWFKNQGDCVSYVATGGKNPPNG